MDKKGGSGSPGWTAPYFTQATEDVVRAVAAAASAATVRSSRPSVVFSSKDGDNNGQLQKLQRHVVRVLKGFSPQPEVKIRAYNPEILTSQKRQWARFQLQSLIKKKTNIKYHNSAGQALYILRRTLTLILTTISDYRQVLFRPIKDQRLVREPSRIFESLVVVGLHPNSDVQTLQKQLLNRNTKGLRASRSAINFEQLDQSAISFEPQVLFVYPPEKQLPLKYKDLVSLCFPGGQEVHIVERTPSMSELNEILLGQEHLKQSNLSFVFRLQVADDSTLYGCCVLVEEIVQKPSGLISMLLEDKPAFTTLSRHILTAPRCYCILSRLPFFDLHFGILKSIFVEEHLQRLTEGIDFLSLMTHEEFPTEPDADTIFNAVKTQGGATEGLISGHLEHSEASAAAGVMNDKRCSCNSQIADVNPYQGDDDSSTKFQDGYEIEDHIVNPCQGDDNNSTKFQDSCGIESRPGNCSVISEVTKIPDKITHEVVLPLLRFHRRDGSESSTSFQGSPCADLNYRSAMEEELEEPSSSGRDESNNHDDILSWAKANNNGSLQIICEYYQLQLPSRGSTLTFHPLEHLHPLKYHRHEETQLQIAGSTNHPRSSSTSLKLPEVRNALLVDEEAASLSVWTVACICGNLRLESVLLMFAGALLEKQIVAVCSNLGVLSATVLSIVPLIRPYQWQSLLMPVLPNDMLDFLDAPVPYIVGIKDITAELQLKLVNNILVDVNKNQVRSPLLPQLPNQKELISSLSPYHATLVGESYLARKRLVYECTDTQVEAAKGFLAVLRSYLDSLCSNLRSHTITNVQSNDDKVSLLLRESFIDSFANRDRPFMRLFVDTQLFSVHTDLILSFYQKD